MTTTDPIPDKLNITQDDVVRVIRRMIKVDGLEAARGAFRQMNEAWRIHDAVKRLVAYQRVPEICAYLKELKQKGKVLLPSVSAVMYKELVRLGMPTGDGYSEKHFSNSYTK